MSELASDSLLAVSRHHVLCLLDAGVPRQNASLSLFVSLLPPLAQRKSLSHQHSNKFFRFSVVFDHLTSFPLSSNLFIVTHWLTDVSCFPVFSHVMLTQSPHSSLSPTLPREPCLYESSHSLTSASRTTPQESFLLFLFFTQTSLLNSLILYPSLLFRLSFLTSPTCFRAQQPTHHVSSTCGNAIAIVVGCVTDVLAHCLCCRRRCCLLLISVPCVARRTVSLLDLSTSFKSYS